MLPAGGNHVDFDDRYLAKSGDRNWVRAQASGFTCVRTADSTDARTQREDR